MARERIATVVLYGLVCMLLALSNCSSGGGGGGGGGPIAPAANISGTWTVDEGPADSSDNSCDDPAIYHYDIAITHSGTSNSFTLVDLSDSDTYTGTISGTNLSYSGPATEPSCDLGLTLNNVSLTLNAAGNIATGSAAWTCNYTGGSCSGTTAITATKQSSGGGITISGWVIDYDWYDVPGATVTLRKASDNSTITSALTDVNGDFSLNYVPVAGQEVYLNASASNYVSSNSEIVTPASSMSDIELTVFDAGDAVAFVNYLTGHSGTTWTSDTFYTGKSWIILDVFDMNWYFISGVTFTPNPAATLLKYNDGSDGFVSTTGPTVGDPGGQTMYGPSAAGYYAAGTSFTVSAAKSGSATQSAKLPFVPGEIAYTYFMY